MFVMLLDNVDTFYLNSFCRNWYFNCVKNCLHNRTKKLSVKEFFSKFDYHKVIFGSYYIDQNLILTAMIYQASDLK